MERPTAASTVATPRQKVSWIPPLTRSCTAAKPERGAGEASDQPDEDALDRRHQQEVARTGAAGPEQSQVAAVPGARDPFAQPDPESHEPFDDLEALGLDRVDVRDRHRAAGAQDEVEGEQLSAGSLAAVSVKVKRSPVSGIVERLAGVVICRVLHTPGVKTRRGRDFPWLKALDLHALFVYNRGVDAVRRPAGWTESPRRPFCSARCLDPPWSMRIEDEAPLCLVALTRGVALYPGLHFMRYGCARRMSPSSAGRTTTRWPTTRVPRRKHTSLGQKCYDARRGRGAADAVHGRPHPGVSPRGTTVMLNGTYEAEGEVSRRLMATADRVGLVDQPRGVSTGRRLRSDIGLSQGLPLRTTRSGAPPREPLRRSFARGGAVCASAGVTGRRRATAAPGPWTKSQIRREEARSRLVVDEASQSARVSTEDRDLSSRLGWVVAQGGEAA